VTGEFGLFVPTLLLVLAIYFWIKRNDLPPLPTVTP
jgi:hypothetical protein